MGQVSVLSDAPVTFLQDNLGYKRYVDPLVGVLTNPNTETPFTIGIFGAWGSGKSSLLAMIDERLADKHRDEFIRVHFNPWVYRREPQMLVPLLHTLRDRLAEDGKRRFVDTVKKLGTILVTLTADELLKKVTANAVSLQRLGELEKRYADARSIVQSQTRVLRKALETEIGKLADDTKVVFFVDDLDRCEPHEIIDLLESIKLFLDIPGVFVILAIAKEVVDRGVAVKYRGFDLGSTAS